MNVTLHSGVLPLNPLFVGILDSHLARVEGGANTAVVINFRGPDYSAETGGFHPVEVSIDCNGRVRYVTDFAYVGQPPFAELVKELDFDFGLAVFQQFSHEAPIEAGRAMFALWQRNFVAYHEMGVYQVDVTQEGL